MTPAEATARHVELMFSLDGVSAETDHEIFGHACAPNGPPSAQLFFCVHNAPLSNNSPCEVVAVGGLVTVLAEAGCTELQEPLDVTGAVGEWGRAKKCASACNALHTPLSPGKGLRVGCIVHFEDGHGRHWRTIVEDLGGGRYRTIDGTLINGWGVIHCVEVTITNFVDHTPGSGMHPIVDWIDAGEIFEQLLGNTEIQG